MEMMINYESRISKEKMMRKLFLLILVLGIASIAGAGLSLSVNGQANPGWITTLAPSDTIVLDVHATAGFGLGDFLISLSNAQASLDATGVVFSQGYTTMYIPAYGPITQPWDLDWARIGTLPCLCGPDPQHFDFGGGNLPPTVTMYDELIMDGLVLHRDGPLGFTVTLEEYIGSGEFVVLDTLFIPPVPEPVTIALFLMGGMFLRGRKKT